MIFNPITTLQPRRFLTLATTATTDSIESISLYFSSLFLLFSLFLSPLYLLLRFLLELLKLGARQYRCSRDMSDRLYLLSSRFTVQYEFIKSYGYVEVARVLAKRLARSWNEWLTGSVCEIVTNLRILHSVSHLLEEGTGHIFAFSVVQDPLFCT